MSFRTFIRYEELIRRAKCAVRGRGDHHCVFWLRGLLLCRLCPHLLLNFTNHLGIGQVERPETFHRKNSLAKLSYREILVHFSLKIGLVLFFPESFVLVERGKVLVLGRMLEDQRTLTVTKQGLHSLSLDLLSSLMSIVLLVAASHYVHRIVLVCHSVLLVTLFVESRSGKVYLLFWLRHLLTIYSVLSMIRKRIN